jgi:hypothetical protein
VFPMHAPFKGRSRGVSVIPCYRMQGTTLVRAREHVIGGTIADPLYVPDGTSAKGNP